MKFFRFANRILNVGGLLLIAMLVSIHSVYAWQAHATAASWEERVFVIEQRWQYKLLNPLLSRDTLGYSLPLLSVAYVNQAAAERLGTDIAGVRRHEAKHLGQANQLGLLRYYRLDEWKREGIAEYVRGGPTISVCTPNFNENSRRLAYRTYYVVTQYLIDEKGLSEAEIYEYKGYPVEEAEKWLDEVHCSSR